MANLFDIISQNPNPADSAEPAGLPSYLEAVNGHVQPQGGFSLVDPTTYGEGAANAGKFAVATITRAVASVYNIVPTAVNWFGGNMQEADTFKMLQSLDNNLALYYADNEGIVNVAGDLLGSIVPGMVGVKGLRAAQGALALYAKGKGGMNFARNVGLLPTYATATGFNAGRSAAIASESFTWANPQVLKSVAAGFAQQSLEGAAFMTLAGAAMPNSPLFENQDAGDILWNGISGGGLLGAGIMGSVAAAQTVSAVRKGVKAADAFLRPAKTLSHETAYGATAASERIIYALDDLHNPPRFAPSTSDADVQAFNRQLARRQDQLKNIVREAVHEMTDDKQLGNVLADSLLQMDQTTASANSHYLKAVGRLGSVNRLTTLEREAIAAEKAGQTVPNVAINYLNLRTGEVLLERPPVVSIADTVKDAKDVEAFVRAQKFKLEDQWAPSLAKSAQEAEARSIWASMLDYSQQPAIKPFDVPVLDAAIASGVQSINVEGRGLLTRQEAIAHVTNIKLAEAELIAANAPKMSTAELAARTNTTAAFLEAQDQAGLFAFQQQAEGAWRNPTYAKLAYDVQPMYGVDGFVLDAITHAKEQQRVYRQAAEIAFAKQFPEDYNSMPVIGDRALATANRYGSGTGFFKGANENYGSLGSAVQAVGAVAHKLKERIINGLGERFNAPRYQIAQDSLAQEDIVVVYNKLLSTGERHVLRDGKVMTERAAAALDEGLDIPADAWSYEVKSTAAWNFLEQWVAHNDKYLVSKAERLALQVGGGTDVRTGHIYIPPPDPKKYNHFAFVVDRSITNQGHVRMIHAASQSELDSLAAKVTDPNARVIFKQDSEAFFKAQQDYDYALGINEAYVNSAVARTGSGGHYFAVTDANKILDEIMEWRQRADVSNMREYIKLKYAPEVTELNRLASSWDAAALSRKAYTGKYAGDATANPYKSFVDTMLDVSARENYPIWTPLNRLMETGASKIAAAVVNSAQSAKTADDLTRVNAYLEQAGISSNLTDAATMAWANHVAPKPVLEEFVRKGNSLLSFLMLRSDPLNAINNGIGHSVLYGTETRNLIAKIKAGNAEAAGQLAELANVKVPGGIGEVLSPNKLATNAYAAYAKMLGGDPAMKDLETVFRRHGWMPSFTEQDRAVIQNLTLTGKESASQLRQRIESAVQAVTKYPVKFNQGVEDMNRFVSAYTAKSITDIAVKHGVMTPDDAFSYINTFVNRTQGNYIASQRPMLFQGPVGQAVGLFQTYQFNLMQQLFRYVGERDRASVATLLGLQGSIYGMNGLPAFNYINQHIVGQASGNTGNADIVSQTYKTVGKETGDWLMYGLASNMFLHPDLKVNLYTRGDINPRQVTVIPTNIADVPIVGAFGKFFGSVVETAKRVSAGGDPYSTVLQGIEHAGISRPLAGLAQAMQAFGNADGKVYSTTSQGSLLMANDFLSLATLARVAGGRPLDEAIANDALYRIKSYESAQHAKINQLGSAVRSKIQTGESLDQETINGFMRQYVERGGKQEQFNKFMARQMMQANTAQANQIVSGLKGSHSQYMQTIMGGYELQDLK